MDGKTPVIEQGTLSGVLDCKWTEQPELQLSYPFWIGQVSVTTDFHKLQLQTPQRIVLWYQLEYLYIIGDHYNWNQFGKLNVPQPQKPAVLASETTSS